MSRRSWTDLTAAMTHAFQPIVQMRTGQCHGFEALLRGWKDLGFDAPQAVFDAADADGALAEVEAALIAKAIQSFGSLEGARSSRLFLNVDARLSGAAEMVITLARAQSLNIVHEISERDTTAIGPRLEAAVERYRQAGVGIALDDFGVGYGGLRLLYEARSDYVKIDRFFIDGIEHDLRKRAIVGYLVSYAHALGISTIAEGVETAAQFYVCRDAGCDFAQGYLLERPARYEARLPASNAAAERLNREDRRKIPEVRKRLSELLERIPTLLIDTDKSILLSLFRDPGAPSVVPVLGRDGIPRGLIRERDLKPLFYSRYGTDLLRNRLAGSKLSDFVVPCVICDIDTPLEQVVEIFSEDSVSDGVIIVEAGKYIGFLGSHSLLRLVHERRLAAAADQNPLTRLPGNDAIVQHVETIMADPLRTHTIAYIDFDHFKPFNDAFGFRQGDRAILMFSERLRLLATAWGGFAGHVGGDDFVLVLSGLEAEHATREITGLLARFRSDAESLYDAETREQGLFTGKDRDGTTRAFPLLSASAVVLHLPVSGVPDFSVEMLISAMAANKAAAKAAPAKICCIQM